MSEPGYSLGFGDVAGKGEQSDFSFFGVFRGSEYETILRSIRIALDDEVGPLDNILCTPACDGQRIISRPRVVIKETPYPLGMCFSKRVDGLVVVTGSNNHAAPCSQASKYIEIACV